MADQAAETETFTFFDNDGNVVGVGDRVSAVLGNRVYPAIVKDIPSEDSRRVMVDFCPQPASDEYFAKQTSGKTGINYRGSKAIILLSKCGE